MSLELRWEGGVAVDGDADDTTAHAVVAGVEAVHRGGPLRLLLYGLDLDTGGATVAWHQAVRTLRDRHGRVVLVDAPQMLAHSLYKVGDLADGRVELVTPRRDEGTTAN